MLRRSELLRHESSRTTVLPCQSLTIHCAYTGFGCVTYEPYRLFCGWLYRFNNRSLVIYLLDHIKADLVEGVPMEWHSILGHGQEWTGVCSDIGEEIPNIIHKSHEALDIIVILGSALLPDMGHLVSVGC